MPIGVAVFKKLLLSYRIFTVRLIAQGVAQERGKGLIAQAACAQAVLGRTHRLRDQMQRLLGAGHRDIEHAKIIAQSPHAFLFVGCLE